MSEFIWFHVVAADVVVDDGLLHGRSSFWDTAVFLRLTALPSGSCLLDSQVPPRGWPLQAARPKHAEGQLLPATVGARALTTTTSPNLSPLHPHLHHQVTTKKVSHFLWGSLSVCLSADLSGSFG